LEFDQCQSQLDPVDVASEVSAWLEKERKEKEKRKREKEKEKEGGTGWLNLGISLDLFNGSIEMVTVKSMYI
jgi:hypothetical protein